MMNFSYALKQDEIELDSKLSKEIGELKEAVFVLCRDITVK